MQGVVLRRGHYLRPRHSLRVHHLHLICCFVGKVRCWHCRDAKVVRALIGCTFEVFALCVTNMNVFEGGAPILGRVES